jgi:hypothetical protein
VAKPTARQTRRTRLAGWLQIVVAGLVGRWHRFAIADHSMRPTLQDGDWVLAVARPKRVRVGDVVVCDLPGREGFSIVKRIASIDPTSSAIWLVGDDPAAGSVDSRTFGAIPPAAITARVALRYRPLPPSLIR